MTLPAEMNLTVCRSCGAKIFFAATAKGRMPLDAKPKKAMTISPVGNGHTEHRIVWVDVFESHFSTCPKAEAHRKKR